MIESIVSKKNLNLRLALAITLAFEGVAITESDYAGPNKLSKDSAGRELQQAVEAGLLEVVNPQFRAGASLLREVAAGLGVEVDEAPQLSDQPRGARRRQLTWPRPALFVHCDDFWVVVDCPGLTLSYTGLVPF